MLMSETGRSGCPASGVKHVLTIAQRSYPFGLAGVQESSSTERFQHLTSEKSVIVASERGAEGEWEMSL